MVDGKSSVAVGLLREDIKNKVKEFIMGRRYDVYILQYPPGCGKTTTTIMTLLELKAQFAYFGAKHSSIAENVAEKFGILHIQGKGRLCTNLIREKFEKYNVIQSSYTCEDCRKRGFCEYKRLMSDFYAYPCTFAGAHQHYLGMKDFMEKKPFSVAVFDENFLEAMSVGHNFGLEIMQKSIKLLRMMPSDSARNFMIRMFSDLVEYLYTEELTLPDIKKPKKLQNFRKKYQKFIVQRILDKQWVVEDVVSPLIDYLILRNKKIVNRKNVGGHWEVEMLQYDFSKLNTRTPIIILDATTPDDIYRNILEPFGLRVKTIKPEVTVDSHAYQLTHNTYPMKYLKKEPVRNRLFEITKNICKKHEDKEVFICIRKRFEKFLEDYLDGVENANIAHYGGIRGANVFEKADVAVLIGTPIPNPDIVTMKSRIMGVKKDSLFEMECNHEMLQTIHRIRPLLKKETKVYILSKMETGYDATEHDWIPITKMEELVKC
jgi:hypothetical protein